MKSIKLALLFGGPSTERELSFSSARSIFDHLDGEGIEIVPIYFNRDVSPYIVGRDWLHCNTSADFDFKLDKSVKPLSAKNLQAKLRRCDVAFSVLHGVFGEDGQIQKILEQAKIPFVGSSSDSCDLAFDKGTAQALLGAYGLKGTGGIVISSAQAAKSAYRTLNSKAVTIKPTRAGSFIADSLSSSPQEAERSARQLLKRFPELLIAPRIKGRKFTVAVTQNENYEPVCLLPIEIETEKLARTSLDNAASTQKFVYRYPPRFRDLTVKQIRRQAERLFALFGLRDLACFDGWVRENGEVVFSEFHPVPGLEQNSALFVQAARLGFNHREFLLFLVERALSRSQKRSPRVKFGEIKAKRRLTVPVLFGGDSSERQASVMSGTNTWLKLTRSNRYRAEPFFLDSKRGVWSLPYALALNQRAEDIVEACLRSTKDEGRAQRLELDILKALGRPPDKRVSPRRQSLDSFLRGKSFVFLGLHGGFGEDGQLQAKLERKGIRFNGTGSRASRLCMNKFEISKAILDLKVPGVWVTPKAPVSVALLAGFSKAEIAVVWNELSEHFGAPLLVNPTASGASEWSVLLHNLAEFRAYVAGVIKGISRFRPNMFEGQKTPLEMPATKPSELLFERSILTDVIEDRGTKISLRRRSGWIGISIGVIGAAGKMKALTPSVIITRDSNLPVDDATQGLRNINLTPPPLSVMPARVTKLVQTRVAMVANGLGLAGYSKIDAFVERRTGNLMITDVSTLPALSVSTTLFHQGLAENPKVYPRSLLERIIELGGR